MILQSTCLSALSARLHSRTVLVTAVFLVIGPPAASARDDLAANPFGLGTITVVGQRIQDGEAGDDRVASSISRREMQQFNRDNIGDALNLLSGITLSTNSRNEKTIAVRGFDARQVPLFIDGIPVYVPYDGYVDFDRFTTADLAAIQVAKGFSPVAYGPNTLGGAINLISRKPVGVFEGDASAGYASGDERRLSANVGTNQGLWYLQLGASSLQSDDVPLSSDFAPTATEDGGDRNNAYRRDTKLSFKIGLTPNARDEYAISYYRQDGKKGQPPSTDPAAARYWRWPYWDKESLYFVSTTALGNHEVLNLRLYHDRFDNEVDSYTDGSYTVLRTSGRGSVSTGRSIYNDRTDGGSIDIESSRFATHTLRLITHYKTDEHQESDATGKQNTHFDDTLFSIAAEDSIQLASQWKLSLGLARHALRPQEVFSIGNPYSLPDDQTANDAQAGVFYDRSASARFYATIARKSRLPTLKDRYSQRLGTYIENPDLRPEQSVNYEIGYQGAPWTIGKAEVALFYSDITNKIQSVSNVSGTRSQMQNVGKVRVLGTELGLQGDVTNWLELGGRYTLVDLDNRSNPAIRLTDIPRHKVTAHALWRASEHMEVLAFAERNSGRWASSTIRLANFTTLNLKTSYRPMQETLLEAGVTNLTDRNYTLADGFPSPGRMWFVDANYQF